MSIAANIALVREQICKAALTAGRSLEEVCLLAAAKRQSVDKIREAIAAGADAIGENRVQEMLDKADAYTGAPLHFIGRLQKNKIKHVVGRVSLIHSIEDLEQAECVARAAEALNLTQDVLLQVNIAHEPTKGGFPPEAVETALSRMNGLRGLRVRGLMCIPPPPVPTEMGDSVASLMKGWNGEDKYFSKMRQLYVDIRPIIVDNENSHVKDGAPILSMGMSGDYARAVACGATLVRVGSAIFGARV